MMGKSILAITAAMFVGLTGTANAALQTFDVFAQAHSIQYGDPVLGTGLNTGINLNAGDALTISADPADLWSLGAGAFHNADGTAAFGVLSFAGQTFLGGELVGQIGNGSYFEIGTLFNGVANTNGLLSLFFWDTNNFDNVGFITTSVTYTPNAATVPLPGAFIFMLTALAGGIPALRRRVLGRR